MPDRPLIRWCCGETPPWAEEAVHTCLAMAIRFMRRRYDDRCDFVVICGTEATADVARLAGAEALMQPEFEAALPVPPKGPAWKLYPPRLRLDAPELFLDNDLVLDGGLPILDAFLAGEDDRWLITEARERCYGAYDGLVAEDILFNSGLIGVPAGVDFGQLLRDGLLGPWAGHFDEQGLVASVVSRQNYQLVSRDDVEVWHPARPYRRGRVGVHLVGLNGGFDDHWQSYLAGSLL